MLKIRLTLLLQFLMASVIMQAQNNYSNYAMQTSRLNALAKNYPQLATLKSLTKTSGNKDVWQLTIGSGNTGAKPAIAIVGGVEGHYLLGTELAIGFAENLLQGATTDSIKMLLSKTTFYIFPNMSPDAMEQYFAPLKYERQGNNTPTDDDRDGRNNEDGFEDLDGNGKITMLRIESPIGEYKLHPDDARMLVKADVAKGEKGKYLMIAEGINNDKDESFNEDGEGGVWFNKNLTYKHPSFSPGTGEYPASEKETRALLDYLYEQYNVYALISYGSNNNLSTPATFNAAAVKETIITGWLEGDVKVNAMVAELYNKTTGLKDAPKAIDAGGDFLSWGYYHYGRYSFSTPGWWVPKTKPDTTKGEKAFTQEDATANYLRWAAREGIANTFTPWKTITHPDFEGQQVEVGGIDPFVLTTPPYQLTPGLVKKNTEFLVKLAGYQPELDIVQVKTEKLGNGVSRVSISIINKGALAYPSKMGEKSYWIKRINVKVKTAAEQMLLSGKKIQVLNSIEGYGTKQLTWLIKGSGKISIEAGCTATGIKTIDINL